MWYVFVSTPKNRLVHRWASCTLHIIRIFHTCIVQYNSVCSSCCLFHLSDKTFKIYVQNLCTSEMQSEKYLMRFLFIFLLPLQGFICQARNKEDLFTKQQLTVIFGNIEEIYRFHQSFLASLEKCIDLEMPHVSEIGDCFLRNVSLSERLCYYWLCIVMLKQVWYISLGTRVTGRGWSWVVDRRKTIGSLFANRMT